MQVIPLICFLCGSGRSAGVDASSIPIICLPFEVITPICVTLGFHQSSNLRVCVCVCVVPLTHDIEPLLPMRLRQDDAHHLSDAVRFYDSEVDVWLDEHDWFCRGRREGDPLDVESSGG